LKKVFVSSSLHLEIFIAGAFLNDKQVILSALFVSPFKFSFIFSSLFFLIFLDFGSFSFFFFSFI